MNHLLNETIIAMQREFSRAYYLEEGGQGITWKFCEDGRGDILRATTRALLLRDIQNYRKGLRDA